MILAASQTVTPRVRLANAGDTYTFEVTAQRKGCPTPILVYVRARDSSTPHVASAKATVTYKPPGAFAPCQKVVNRAT